MLPIFSKYRYWGKREDRGQITLMYYSFDMTYSIDLRGYTDMTLLSYVEARRTQVVVCVRDYEQLLSLFGNGYIG